MWGSQQHVHPDGQGSDSPEAVGVQPCATGDRMHPVVPSSATGRRMWLPWLVPVFGQSHGALPVTSTDASLPHKGFHCPKRPKAAQRWASGRLI